MKHGDFLVELHFQTYQRLAKEAGLDPASYQPEIWEQAKEECAFNRTERRTWERALSPRRVQRRLRRKLA